MKTSEFTRWLVAQGVEIVEGSKHTKLYYGKKRSTLSRQKEIADLHAENVKKQLGLK
jgi:mRNA interferase HicA